MESVAPRNCWHKSITQVTDILGKRAGISEVSGMNINLSADLQNQLRKKTSSTTIFVVTTQYCIFY